jgi:hypothetical protein
MENTKSLENLLVILKDALKMAEVAGTLGKVER